MYPVVSAEDCLNINLRLQAKWTSQNCIFVCPVYTYIDWYNTYVSRGWLIWSRSWHRRFGLPYGRIEDMCGSVDDNPPGQCSLNVYEWYNVSSYIDYHRRQASDQGLRKMFTISMTILTKLTVSDICKVKIHIQITDLYQMI